MKIKRILVYIVITPIYWFSSLIYDKKYLTGKFFLRDHFSIGWKWVLKYWYYQKIKGINRHVPFPVPPWVQLGDAKNIIFDVNDMPNFHSVGCCFQALGAKLIIGSGTIIAPNCGFITANHDLNDFSKSAPGKDITIGRKCWIGMNCMILPGITLGDNTIVGAGSVVTKSFPEGNCIIAGNPAKKIRDLD